MTSDPVRLAMIGGGPGAFIGPVHAMAARLAGNVVLVAGAFSSDGERNLAGGRAHGIAADRCYPDWREMLRVEAAMEDGAELVAVVTPNHLHHPMATAALTAGFHVLSDKPATATLDEALDLEATVRTSGRLYALSYTYTGYPMVRRARQLVAQGAIGAVRKVVVTYAQGWLADAAEAEGNKQAGWRTDPASAGAGGAIGDIGVHAFQLAEWVSGERVARIVADLSSVVAGRRLDDDCNLLLRFAGGQPGVLIASQIATGLRNNLTIAVHGTVASLIWEHEVPDVLRIEHGDGRTELLHAGIGAASAHRRLPAGHPEGFIEAFANIYADLAKAIRAGAADLPDGLPGIEDGVRSLRFVERAASASRERAGWTSIEGDRGSRLS